MPFARETPSLFADLRAESPCVLCGSRDARMLALKSRDGAKMITVLCMACGVGRTDPMPAEETLAEYYRDEYRRDYKGVAVPKKKHVLRAARLASSRLQVLRKRLPAGSRLLDVGAGSGEFVRLAMAAGYRAEGVEPNGGYSSYASATLGLPVVTGTWQTLAGRPERYGGITMFHVLEHLADPAECLRRLRDLLDPGGLLLVEVPNLLTPVGQPARRFHRAHLTHFTPVSLANLVRTNGFEILSQDAPGDGANAVVLGRRTENPRSGDAGRAAGVLESAERILAFERGRPRLPYAHPSAWLRFFRKLAGMLEEKRTARRFADGRAILEWVSATEAAIPPGGSATIRP